MINNDFSSLKRLNFADKKISIFYQNRRLNFAKKNFLIFVKKKKKKDKFVLYQMKDLDKHISDFFQICLKSRIKIYYY